MLGYRTPWRGSNDIVATRDASAEPRGISDTRNACAAARGSLTRRMHARARAAARVSRGQCTVKRRHIYWAHGRAAPCCHDYDTTTSTHTAAAAIYGTADRPAQLPARPHGTYGVSNTEYKQLTPKDKCASALALQPHRTHRVSGTDYRRQTAERKCKHASTATQQRKRDDVPRSRPPVPVLLRQPYASHFLGLLGCRRSHTAHTACQAQNGLCRRNPTCTRPSTQK